MRQRLFLDEPAMAAAERIIRGVPPDVVRRGTENLLNDIRIGGQGVEHLTGVVDHFRHCGGCGRESDEGVTK